VSAFISTVVDWRLLLFQLVLANVVVPNARDPQVASLWTLLVWFLIAALAAARVAVRDRQLPYRDAIRRLRPSPETIEIVTAPWTYDSDRFARELEQLLRSAGWQGQRAGDWMNAQALQGLIVGYPPARDPAPFRELASVLTEMGYLARANADADSDEAYVVIAENFR